MKNTDPILRKYNYSSWSEAAEAKEMEAQEWSETDNCKEMAGDAMFTAATCRKLEAALKALGNCYALARRAHNRFPKNLFPVQMTHDQRVQKDNWEHIIRFCEETGMTPEILRAAVPTEIAGG